MGFFVLRDGGVNFNWVFWGDKLRTSGVQIFPLKQKSPEKIFPPSKIPDSPGCVRNETF